jgi:hypothetical protein
MMRSISLAILVASVPSAAFAHSQGMLMAESHSPRADSLRECFSGKGEWKAWSHGGIQIPGVCVGPR